jgi:hypothetical protein
LSGSLRVSLPCCALLLPSAPSLLSEGRTFSEPAAATIVLFDSPATSQLL